MTYHELINPLDRDLLGAATRIRHRIDDPHFPVVSIASITFTRAELNALRLLIDAIGVPPSPPADHEAPDGDETVRDIVFPAASRN